MKRILPLLATAAALALTAPAFADDWTSVLKKADANDDGMIDKLEVMNFADPLSAPGFKPFFAVHFDQIDKNGDGMLEMAEVKRAMKAMKLSDAQIASMFSKRIYDGL
ncbi:MAG: hypothetical protein AAF184_17715 [Pseudomonadota bacterium]